MTGQDFERSMVHAFNDYASLAGINLIAYRHIQTRYVPQLFDVHVDSDHHDFYLALECKSIDASKDYAIYFSQHFHVSKGVHQLERESNWLDLSGRMGYLVVELRKYSGNRSECRFLPWSIVRRVYRSGSPGVRVDEIAEYPGVQKRSGKYIFDVEDIKSIIQQ